MYVWNIDLEEIQWDGKKRLWRKKPLFKRILSQSQLHVLGHSPSVPRNVEMHTYSNGLGWSQCQLSPVGWHRITREKPRHQSDPINLSNQEISRDLVRTKLWRPASNVRGKNRGWSSPVADVCRSLYNAWCIILGVIHVEVDQDWRERQRERGERREE